MPRFASTRDVEVAAYDLGGDGPPLLLAHATGFHGRVLAPLAARLADRFHGYAFDERGHGDSGVPAGLDFDWHGLADDVLATVDGFGLERPVGFGHSAGAAALLLAEAARPGTFAGLYCYEAIVIPGPALEGPHDNPLAEGAVRRRPVFASRDEAFANYAGKPPFSVLDHEVLRAYVDHGFRDRDDGTVELKCKPEHEAAMYRMSFVHGAYERFPEIRCPVVLACGEHTDAFPPALVARQAEPLPDVRIEVFPDLGHFGPLQDPDTVAASLAKAFG